MVVILFTCCRLLVNEITWLGLVKVRAGLDVTRFAGSGLHQSVPAAHATRHLRVAYLAKGLIRLT